MLIREVIEKVSEMKPSQYDQEQMCEWISQLDQKVYDDLLRNYVGSPCKPKKYELESDLNKRLLIPSPYDSLYIMYISAQIDYFNAEFDRYNNDMIAFNNEMQNFTSAYNREHKHKTIYTKGLRVDRM